MLDHFADEKTRARAAADRATEARRKNKHATVKIQLGKHVRELEVQRAPGAR